MSRRAILRRSRLMRTAIAGLILAVPGSAALADPGPATLQTYLKAHKIRFGETVVERGRAPASEAGQVVMLEFAPAGQASWQPIATGRISQDGTFHLSAALRSSGAVRVSTTTSATSPVAAAA